MSVLKALYPFVVFGFELLRAELKKPSRPSTPAAPMTPEEVNLMRWPTEPPKKNG